MRTRAALWVCAGVTAGALTGACGDDNPAKDAVGDVAVGDGDAVEEATPDATEADVADVADVADLDSADSADVADVADVADTAIPADATPEQRAILTVGETERFELKGLSGPVQVVRTEGSTPHVYANNLSDLGRVLGFVQARDRFFLMDLQRRLGLGTVAGLLGSLGLSQDIESRATGMRYVTDRLVANMSPELAAYLSAFADGVNAYIDAVRDGTLSAPTETQFAAVLGYATPSDMMSPFALRDVVALATVYMYNLNFEGGDPGTQAAADRLEGQFAGVTDEALRKSGYLADIWNDVRGMFPNTNSTEGFGVGKANHPPAARGKPKRLPEGMAQKLYDKIQARLLRMGKDREAGFGSNVWAISGDKTADGSALFANDGHLELTVPPLGYGAALDTKVFGGGDIQQVGGWLGNFPVLVGGTNGNIAWGGVNPVMDITDWYREELLLDESGAPKSSLFKGEWKDLVAVDESFTVADVPFLDSVGHTESWQRWTTFDGRWLTSIEGRIVATIAEAGEDAAKVINVMGDLVIPGDSDGDKVITAISFDFAGLDATKWPDSIFETSRATSVEGVRESLRGLVGGGLFTGAADGHGSILFSSYQAVPCRGYLPRGQDGVFITGADPTRLLDGTEYGGFTIPTDAAGKADEVPGQSDPQKCVVPASQMPYALDPPSGIVFSANSDPAGITDDGDERNDAYLIGGPYASVRANTIRRALLTATADKNAKVEDMEALQANIESRLGEQFVPYLAAAIDKAAAAAEGPLAELYGDHGERLLEAQARLLAWKDRGFLAYSGVETFYSGTIDAGMHADSVATMIFNAYIRRFFVAVWDDEGINAERWGGEARPTALLRFLAGRGAGNPSDLASWNPATEEAVFFDVLGTEAKESSDELMVQALVAALAYLESPETAPGMDGFGTPDMDEWLWGLRHQVRFESILKSYGGGNPALALFTAQFEINTDRIPLAANIPNGDPRKDLIWFPRGGDQWGVDAANPGFGGDFTHGSGPAMRMIFKLKDGKVEGRYVLPGGQSGITDSEYFADQTKLWLANKYNIVRFTPDEVSANALGRELYLPAP